LIVVLSPAPSWSGSPDKSPARTLQLASPTATGSDELRLAHHARGAGRGRAPARCWPADPRWALVDGFAHRNAPGSRHRARWQDIEDLLAAGIDVISTVSVGHLDNYSAWSTVTLNERIAALAAEATAILAGCLLWLRLLSAAERLGFSYR